MLRVFSLCIVALSLALAGCSKEQPNPFLGVWVSNINSKSSFSITGEPDDISINFSGKVIHAKLVNGQLETLEPKMFIAYDPVKDEIRFDDPISGSMQSFPRDFYHRQSTTIAAASSPASSPESEHLASLRAELNTLKSNPDATVRYDRSMGIAMEAPELAEEAKAMQIQAVPEYRAKIAETIGYWLDQAGLKVQGHPALSTDGSAVDVIVSSGSADSVNTTFKSICDQHIAPGLFSELGIKKVVIHTPTKSYTFSDLE